MQRHIERYDEIQDGLTAYERDHNPLNGIRRDVCRDVFVRQIIDSLRRVEYVYNISSKQPSQNRRNPKSEYFDPLKASILFRNEGNIEEAFWLAFLAINFGKHRVTGWSLVRVIYGCLGSDEAWTWDKVRNNKEQLYTWLEENNAHIEALNPKPKFGNHRKYETISTASSSSNFYTISDYIDLINTYGSHAELIKSTSNLLENDPYKIFDYLYSEISCISRFGRTAKFDYLTMISKLGLYNIMPPIAYLGGATGPKLGAKLLFLENPKGRVTTAKLQEYITTLNSYLNLGSMAMQVLEDALCNWQKNPNNYKLFSG